MTLELVVELREPGGKRNARRLRQAGKIPAILYGHGLECVPLSVAADAISSVIRHGGRLVTLTGAVNESAFIRDLQWDTWGLHLLHVDFTRISAHEIVEVKLPVELRGESPGVREGGAIVQHIHEVELACPAALVPEKLTVNINHLQLNGAILLKELEIPQGAKILASDLETVVVECVVPQEMPEEVAAEAAPGEPEVIGAKPKEEEEEEEE